MAEPMPILLIPGLLESPRFYAAQLAPLWRRGLVAIANHTQDDSIAAIAKRILADAPRRFALAGHSMGGYIAFEIMRQAPERVARLALIDTSARPDMPEQTERRQLGMAMAREGRFGKITEMLFPMLVHPNHRMDAALLELVQAMADDCGADAYIRQQTAIIGRADSRTTLAAIRCPTLVLSFKWLIFSGSKFLIPCRTLNYNAHRHKMNKLSNLRALYLFDCIPNTNSSCYQ